MMSKMPKRNEVIHSGSSIITFMNGLPTGFKLIYLSYYYYAESFGFPFVENTIFCTRDVYGLFGIVKWNYISNDF